jgi:two-component system sensor histidine kinase RegB
MPQLGLLDKEAGESRLRLQTAVRLRWFGVVGQLATISFVRFGLGFEFDIGICLALIALSAWLNVFLRMRYRARTRLSVPLATILLAYDIVQLAALLYLTGGIENPFVFLIVAPVTVSAATLPPRNTIALGVLAALATTALTFFGRPLPWAPPGGFDLPTLYNVGALASVLAGMLFLALYAWRLAKESRQMADALSATEMVLAREQQLHALDGLAAAAAHELGTPLSTIAVVAKELARDAPPHGAFADDLALLQSQAERCREILRKLTRGTQQPDPLLAQFTVRELIEEAAAPYRGYNTKVVIGAAPEAGSAPAAAAEPVGQRRPGVLYGVGNLIENAVDFARETVQVTATWSEREVAITIADDGPGVPSLVLEALGEPYITTRPTRHHDSGADRGPTGGPTGARVASRMAWAWGSSSPRPCCSDLGPRSRWTTGRRPPPAPLQGSSGPARFSRAARKAKTAPCRRRTRGSGAIGLAKAC